MEDFNFKEWVKNVPKDAAKTLEDEGFDTYIALANASEDDIKELPLKRGHLVATVAAVRELQQATSGPLARAKDSPHGGAKDSPLERLLGQRVPLDQLLPGPGGACNLQPVTRAVYDSATLRADLEPQVYLGRQTTASAGDALRIINFVSMCESDTEGVEHRLAEGVAIVLPRSRPRLEAITPAQWIAANSRIMATLMQRGELAGEGLLDYLAYTAKIGEMATRFTWVSVLQYDDQYRASQAAFKFRWGSDCQHLALVALRERQKQHQPASSAAPPHLRPPNKASGGEACKLWNRGQCTYQHCKFQHVCSTCGKADHDMRAHNQQQQQQQPQPAKT
jgi:hypothetical protein